MYSKLRYISLLVLVASWVHSHSVFAEEVNANIKSERTSIPYILKALENYDRYARRFHSKYIYENEAGKDAVKYLCARRAIASGNEGKQLPVYDDESLSKRLKTYFGKWECDLKTDGGRIAFICKNADQKLTNYFDGERAFFEGNSPDRWFWVGSPVVKQPLLSEVLRNPIWSFGVTQLNPFTFTDRSLKAWIEKGINEQAVSLTEITENIFRIRIGDSRPRGKVNKKYGITEVTISVRDEGICIQRISTYLLPDFKSEYLANADVPTEKMTTVEFSGFRTTPAGICLPTIIEAKFQIRLSDLADFSPDVRYEFNKYLGGPFDADEILDVCTHRIIVEEFNEKESLASSEFVPPFTENSSIFSYMLNRNITVEEATGDVVLE